MMLIDFIVALSLCVIIGAFIGAGVTIIIMKKKVNLCGTLRIDRSDPEDGPYMFLEITEDIDKVYGSGHVTFLVNTENYISHE